MFRHDDAAVLSVADVDAPVVKTSCEIDDLLSDTYERTRLRPGLLTKLTGIRERRWWEHDEDCAEGAIEAGRRALASAGVRPDQVGLMVNTSVTRQYLEPSVAVSVHAGIGLSSGCLNFDLANACLGFINGMQVAAAMIDNGQIDYALVVCGENSRTTQERTLDRLRGDEVSADDVVSQFATLTLGSGAVAMVLGRASEHPEGHRILGGATRAATEHHELCVGDFNEMRTDAHGLLVAGKRLAQDLWRDAAGEFDWREMDRYYVHQVSSTHTSKTAAALGIDEARIPLTFPTYGNVGPAAVAITLAKDQASLAAGDRVLMMGIGSGLNMTCLEILW